MANIYLLRHIYNWLLWLVCCSVSPTKLLQTVSIGMRILLAPVYLATYHHVVENHC